MKTSPVRISVSQPISNLSRPKRPHIMARASYALNVLSLGTARRLYDERHNTIASRIVSGTLPPDWASRKEWRSLQERNVEFVQLGRKSHSAANRWASLLHQRLIPDSPAVGEGK